MNSRLPLRSYLARLFFAAVIPLLAFAGLLIYQVVASERQTRLQAMQDVARTLSAAVDAEVERTLLALQMLAGSELIDRGDPAAIRTRFEQAKDLHGRWSSMSLFRADGTRLLNLRVPTGQPIPAASPSAAALDDAVRAGRTYISDVVVSSTSGKPTVFFGVPVFRNGAPAFGIAATMEYDTWTDWLKQRIPQGAIAAIDDRQGVIFARSERPEAFAGKPATDAVRKAYGESPSGVVRIANREGADIYIAYATSQRSGWHTLIISPAGVVDAGPWRYGLGFATATVVLLLLTLVASLGLARPLAQGIEQLGSAIRKVGSGERPERRNSSIAELDDAQAAARAAADRLAAVKEDLVRQREELRTMLDLLPVGVAVAHDTQSTQVTVSPVFQRMLAGAAPLAAGSERTAPPHRYAKDGQELAEDGLPLQRAARTGAEVRDVEIDVTLADGTRRHLLVNAAPLFDDAGRVRGAIAAHIDITSLKVAQQALERADRQKNVFLATLAHELRNPLAPIRYASALLRSPASAAAIQQAHGIIERQAAHMARLLDDLLDLSRISRNVIELKRQRVDVVPIVRAAVDNARPLADEKRQTLTLQEPVEAAWVDADPARLLQVMDNLLNNASKYTPEGGRIVVALAQADGCCEVRVTDSGIGLTPQMIPEMFSLFGQAHRAHGSSGGGLGIGLTVVRQLVELHGGRVDVHSDGPGTGSTFVVRLPRVEPPAAPRAAAPLAAAPVAAPALDVLVVDDNVDAAETLAAVLELSGFTVRTAHTAGEAMARVADWHPAVAVLDIGLPDRSGHELAQQLRAQPWGRAMLLVAVTGWGDVEDRQRSAAAGFDAHLAKPADTQQLIDIIDRFARHGQRDRVEA